MIRKYEASTNLDLINKYASEVIITKRRLINNYREDVYNDFMRLNPDCEVTSHYFTRHINEFFGTKVKLVSDKGKLVYVFVDGGEEVCTIIKHNR